MNIIKMKVTVVEDYSFLFGIAIILFSTKVLGVLSQKVHMPQVVGALIAGILLGPSCFNMMGETEFISKSSEIGVIILMFLAGMDTDLEELKKTGGSAFVIALIGVLVPLIGGYVVYGMFFSDQSELLFYKKIFMGVVLTATSVSISVETLREMGKLKGKMGTAILGAAIIDDILGIIILTVTTSFTNPDVKILNVTGKIGLFFVFVILVGVVVNFLLKRCEYVYGKRRQYTIYCVAFCFVMAYVAEVVFGVADITGAYFAGLILCNITKMKEHIAEKVDVVSYLIFAPIFFASIGLKTNLSGFTTQILYFSIALLIVAILTKIIGCGLGAKMCGFGKREALAIGIGMVSRGEVALIVAQKGEEAGLLDANLFSPVILVVIVTTLITPVMLSAVLRTKESKVQTA